MNLRNLKNIRKSWLNIIGLAIGFSSIIMVSLWVNRELTYDRFHNDTNSLYRVFRKETDPMGSATTPSPLGPVLYENLPDITNFSRFYRLESFLGEMQVESDQNKFFEQNYCFADTSFFSIFNFPFVIGDPKSAMHNPNSVVITEDIAKKYFASENPLGKTIKLTNFGEFNITGVIKNIPSKSHLQFDFISPIEPLISRYSWMKRWNIPHFYTYIKVKNQLDIDFLNNEIHELFNELNLSELTSLNTEYFLQQITEIHSKSELGNELNGNGKHIYKTVKFFSLLAFFVLLISSLNFMIISIAKSFERSSEIAIRKTFGAKRFSIAKLFYFEIFYKIFSAFLIGLVIVVCILPFFNSFLGTKLDLNELTSLNTITSLIIVLLLSSIISGLYPALIISSFKPISIFKGKLFTGKGKSWIIKVFVVIQYTMSIFFIIGSIVYFQQYKFLQKKDLGINIRNVYCIRNNKEVKQQFEAFKATLLENPSILNVSACSDLPTGAISKTSVKEWEGASSDEMIIMNYLFVENDFLKTLGIELTKGRDYFGSNDVFSGFILNQEAEKHMGTEDVLQKKFRFWDKNGEVIGLIKDFNFESLTNNINPLVIILNPEQCKFILISLAENNTKETFNYIEKVFNKFNSDYNFELWSLDESIRNLYQSEQKSARLILIFSILGIIITLFGLYGLVNYSLKLRRKEIGIKKALGANIYIILKIFVKEYAILVIISSLFSWIISYYYFTKWLDNYAYKISLNPLFFIIASFICLVITSAIVLIKTFSTAKINPTVSLKYE